MTTCSNSSCLISLCSLEYKNSSSSLRVAPCSLLLVNSLSVISWNHIQFSVEGKSISLYHIIPTFAGLLVVIDGDDLVPQVSVNDTCTILNFIQLYLPLHEVDCSY